MPISQVNPLIYSFELNLISMTFILNRAMNSECLAVVRGLVSLLAAISVLGI